MKLLLPSSTISSFLLWTAATTTTTTFTDALAPFRYHVKQQQAQSRNPKLVIPLLSASSASSSSSESSTSSSTTTSWSDYKERNIDPSMNIEDHHHKDQLLHGPNVDEEHRQSSDKYWEEMAVHEKNKLKQMNKVDPWWMGMRTSQTSWDAYTKDAIIDRTTSTTNQHDDHTSTINHGPGPGPDVISEQQKEESYQFWLTSLKENKERLHRMEDPWKLQGTDTKLPSIMTPLEQYQHRFLDELEESHHTSPTIGESADNNNNNNQEVRTKSDEFWLQSFLEEKLKIHANEKKEKKAKTEVSSSSPYEKYQHLHLDSIVEQDRRHERRHQDEFGLSKTAISKEQRHKADEFWLQTFLEAKAKLHRNEDKDVDVTP